MKKVYLIAVVFALIAGFATFLFAQEIDKKVSYADASKETIVVASTDIPANTSITTDNYASYLTTKEVIGDYILDGAIKDINQCVGSVTGENIYAGEQVSTKKLITSDSDNATLSLTLPDGYVAYPISASGVQAADGYISVGDKVDVYVYNGGKANIVMSDLEVLKVANNSANVAAETDNSKITDYSTLTFILTEDQALQLMNIENAGQTYKLVLKPRFTGSSNKETIEDAVKNAENIDVATTAAQN